MNEDIDNDTLTRDLKAMTATLDMWCAEQQSHALAFAIATYQRVITTAWSAYDDAQEKLDKWLDGEYDRVEQFKDVPSRKAPMLRLQIQEYLTTIISATEKLTKLAGLDPSTVNLNVKGTISFADLLTLADSRSSADRAGALRN